MKTLEQNHYYPYGMKHSNYNDARHDYRQGEGGVFAVIALVERNDFQYKFNGKEYQDELGLNLYDMDARDYDPAIGRWTGIDPVTHHSMSPYNAFDGNPVFWADPSGADSENDYSKDIFGRDKFDSSGMFIPFGDRGEADSENYLGEDGTGHVATNNDDSDWSPLTSEIFKRYVQEKYGIPDNQLEDFVGKLFESAFIMFGEKNFEKDANFQGCFWSLYCFYSRCIF